VALLQHQVNLPLLTANPIQQLLLLIQQVVTLLTAILANHLKMASFKLHYQCENHAFSTWSNEMWDSLLLANGRTVYKDGGP
jgi:hypothetical protein